MNVCVIVPTYWTWSSKDSNRATNASFDHPTPLDGTSTLVPLIEDLCAQNNQHFTLLVLVGSSHPDLGDEAGTHVRNLLDPFRKRLEIYICDASLAGRIMSRVEIPEAAREMLNLVSYSGIRNFQLFIPLLIGMDVIAALDDDERVKPDYLDNALKYIGRKTDGSQVLGLAGPYLQSDGSVLLNESATTGNAFLDKAHYINAAMRTLSKDNGAIKYSPLTLGGNMVFHRDLFTRVCFDPGITRGEDIDYLINARLQGFQWWFDPALKILHLPPSHYDTPPYQRTREDIFRFLYEREKLRLHGYANPDWLNPYPGALLGANLQSEAASALRSQATPELISRFGEPEKIVEQALDHAKTAAPRYPLFQQAWIDLVGRIEHEIPLREALVSMLINN
jgi:hypothetical protein